MEKVKEDNRLVHLLACEQKDLIDSLRISKDSLIKQSEKFVEQKEKLEKENHYQGWTAEDVMEKAEELGMVLDESMAGEFLEKYWSKIEDRLTDEGWEILAVFLKEGYQP